MSADLRHERTADVTVRFQAGQQLWSTDKDPAWVVVSGSRW